MEDLALDLISGPCSGVSRYDNGVGYGSGGAHPSGARGKRGITQYDGSGPHEMDARRSDGSRQRGKADDWVMFSETDGRGPPRGRPKIDVEWKAAHAAALASDLDRLPAGLGHEQGPDVEAVTLDAVRVLGLRTLDVRSRNQHTLPDDPSPPPIST